MSLTSAQINFAKMLQKRRDEGMGWQFDGLDDWSTDAIFKQLRELHIETDAERFPQQASVAERFKALEDDWVQQIPEDLKEAEPWEDFPLLAIPVLWERLTPQLICGELIDRRLHAVISAEEHNQPLPDVNGLPADLAAALALAKYLEGFAPADRAAKFGEIDERGYYEYVSWLQSLIERRGPAYPDAITQIADVISDCRERGRFQADLALALAIAGRRAEAISRARANVERFPDNIWVRILAGDVFEELEDDAEAIRLWLEALPMAEERFDWEGAIQRLEDACNRTARTEELAKALESYPEPEADEEDDESERSDEEFSATSIFDADLDPPSQLTKARTVGRNDPCPCGSGKKYKKCCMI